MEQILSINKAAGSLDPCTFEIPHFTYLTSFDHLTYHVTLCAKEHCAARFPVFITCICCSVVRDKPNFGSACYSACVVYTVKVVDIYHG